MRQPFKMKCRAVFPCFPCFASVGHLAFVAMPLLNLQVDLP
jgi:hypothetical protein